MVKRTWAGVEEGLDLERFFWKNRSTLPQRKIKGVMWVSLGERNTHTHTHTLTHTHTHTLTQTHIDTHTHSHRYT